MRQPTHGRATRARLWILWVLVSGLWTVAALLRIDRVWVPLIGWHRIIGGLWIWISLVAPPLIFALVIGAVEKRIRGRQ